jgi:DNA-binding CsgD family transcriptional regulator
MTSLDVADVRRVGELVSWVTVAEGRPFPREVMESLREVIPCLDVVYFERGPGCGTVVKAGELEFPPPVVEAMRVYSSQRPTATAHITPTDGAVKLSDRIRRRDLLRLDFYREVMEPLGIEDDLIVLLPAEEHTTAGFSFTRDQPFTDRDLTILELLAPHLARARARMRLQAVRRESDLTEREWEVLEWVAKGKRNKEIASLMGVSVNTVRKHLEHVFPKLGVRTRTAAVAKAFSRDASADAARSR